VGLTPHPKIQQVLEALAAAVVASTSSLGEVGPPLKKVRTEGCLLSMRMWDVVCFLCNLPMFVLELEIR
jgi:hypothetical protein